MSEISLQINGRDVTVKEDTTILDAAQSAGISIPTVCHHEKLEPFGSCRLCTVEVEAGGRKDMVAACITRVQKDQVINTRSDRIDGIRKVLTEQLLAHAPEAKILKDLTRDYGADKDRFPKEPSLCILCGLCVRYCDEIKQKNAVGFVDRGPNREIGFVPEIAKAECGDCMECFRLCPTSALQAAFVLMKSLSSLSLAARPAPGEQKELPQAEEVGK